MKRILAYIEQKKAELEKTPFLAFVRDSSLTPQARFSFVPCVAPFAMGFSDVNKYGLRDESSQDPVQKIINSHTHEDDHHWGMYLKDLRTLEMNDSMDFNGALRMLWGDDRMKTRQGVYNLMMLASKANPMMRMAIVEAIEATGNVASRHFCQLAAEFKAVTGKEIHYFGDLHESVESGHAMGTDDIEERLHAMVYTQEMVEQAVKLVDEVFAIFSDMFEEWLAYGHRALRAQEQVAPSLPGFVTESAVQVQAHL